MPARFVLLGTLFLTSLLASPVRAALSVFWRNNAITPQALANDPALAGMQSWSLMMSHTEGHWRWGGVRLTLPAGDTFYRHPLGGDFLPSASAIAANPALAFHTYVTSPHQIVGNPAPQILTGFPLKEPVSFGGPSDPLPGIISVTWGHPEPVIYSTPPGTYEILRATFPTGVLPVVHPQSYTSTEAPDQTVSIPNIPEPAGIFLVLHAALLLRARVKNGSRIQDRVKGGRTCTRAASHHRQRRWIDLTRRS